MNTRAHRREQSCAVRHGNLLTYRKWIRSCAGEQHRSCRRRTATAVVAGLLAGGLLGYSTSLIHGMHGLPLLAVCLACAGAGALVAVALWALGDHN